MPISEVYNEDCMIGMARYPDGFFDLAIVDPPYFSGPDKLGYYGARTSSTGVFRGEYAKIESWGIPDADYFAELKRVSKNQIVWGVNYFETYLGAGRIVWDKVNGESSFSDAEIAYVSLHDSVRLFRYMWNGMMQGKSVEEGHIMQGNKSLNEKRIHPTQKPVDLYRWLLKKYATPGMKILDTHMGSQSSRIAAWGMGFDYWGWELDAEYFEAGNKRFELATQQQKLFT